MLSKVVPDSVEIRPSEELLRQNMNADELQGAPGAVRMQGQVGSFRENRRTLSGGGGERVVARFESQPPGAIVYLSGQLICQQTPCDSNVETGQHTVVMQMVDYFASQTTVQIEANSVIRQTLQPTFSLLSINSRPSGLRVSINDETAVETPVVRRRVPPGPDRRGVRP